MREVVLPDSVHGWRELLRRALALPDTSIKVPPHFSIVNVDNGLPIQRFGTPLETARQSAVLVAVTPHPVRVGVPPGSAMTDLAKRAASAVAPGNPALFTTAGQPPLKGSLAGDVVQAFQGLDMVLPLTLRTGTLRTHSSQVAFAGGRCDEGESVWQTATREAREEVGLTAELEQIGELSRLYSFPAKAFVRPCVALSETFLHELHPASPDEVASLHFLSLGALLSDYRWHHAFEQDWGTFGHVRMPVFYTTDGVRVWGLTAFVICELVSRIGTVLGWTATLPKPVLEARGDGRLAGVSHVPFSNPYRAKL